MSNSGTEGSGRPEHPEPYQCDGEGTDRVVWIPLLQEWVPILCPPDWASHEQPGAVVAVRPGADVVVEDTDG